MVEQHTSSISTQPKSKKVPIRERAVLVGEMIVVNGYRANRTALKQRFTEGGYTAHETPHFLLFTRSEKPSTILVHWFAPAEITADIAHYLVQELKSSGIITRSQHLDKLFAGIVGGTLFSGNIRLSVFF